MSAAEACGCQPRAGDLLEGATDRAGLRHGDDRADCREATPSGTKREAATGKAGEAALA
ncbi:hypothetical protein [Bosea sp. LC85]|uniref:hypothetical protein n=1 Tax=Bosea sp. LC85 TaxID=1502851 RepID=UPI000A77BA69|nr:hypothetical protein [Bosea sp. LC85]